MMLKGQVIDEVASWELRVYVHLTMLKGQPQIVVKSWVEECYTELACGS